MKPYGSKRSFDTEPRIKSARALVKREGEALVEEMTETKTAALADRPAKTETIFDVWSEGYVATGEAGTATCHGRFSAKTFAEACEKAFAGRGDFDPARLTLWGCRLFDNEGDARRRYG